MKTFSKFIIIIAFTISELLSSLIAHEIVITGINQTEILQLALDQITSPWNKKKFSGDPIIDRFRLENDVDAILNVLKSFGYFEAKISTNLEKDKVIFHVVLNERYKLSDIVLIFDDPTYKASLTSDQLFEIGRIDRQAYIDTKQLADVVENMNNYFKEIGYAFVHVEMAELEIDQSQKRAKAIFRINLNGITIIDKTVLKIKSKKSPDLIEPFIRNRILWCNGEIYDTKKIENTKTDLMDTGIFAVIDVTLTDRIPDPKDPSISHTTAIVSIEEAPLRDISAGIKYGTTEKFGIALSWTHYNIDGKGARFGTLLDFSKNTKTGRIKYNNYDLFGKMQELASQLFYVKENVPTYNVSKFGGESILWNTINRGFRIGAGACFEYSRTKDNITMAIKEQADIISETSAIDNEKTRFSAIGIPIGVNFDSSDNFLDPQKGIVCSGMITPYFSNLKTIAIVSGKLSTYLPIMKNSFRNKMVIASYVKFGSIIRNQNNTIPRDKLFFAGGAHSVRGYGYQKIGEYSADNKPLGGESLFEFGVEPRYRISEDLGVAVFLEGGNVYSSKLPKPFYKPMYGFGFGLRYYTPLGPIRFDLAFPCKRRKLANDDKKHLDSRFNIYISIGQAF
ncbi:MAG: BamA/TamA family outer membrane protein [Holosporales bacterium]|jgi:translocation and assembly module TamA|nr:BamA/TamA family outer membrane protein [Holosporales bacterium]